MSTYPGPDITMKCPICNQKIVLEIIYGAGPSCPPPVAGFKGSHKCPDEIFGTTRIEIFGTAHSHEDIWDTLGIKNPIKENIMSNDQGKQLRSTDIHSKISASLDLARVLSKTAAEIEDKILGTQTPCSTKEEGKEPSAGFILTIDKELHTLHQELLHLKDILGSINSEF